ncbi:MAG: hypothetical protein ACLU99_04620 [Alphaproteobacteria bacterium]
MPELSEESLNQIIFLSCRNVLGRMNLADNNEISTMLLNSLRSSDGIKLRRRVVFSPQTLQPIAQIVSENNHTYYNLKNSYRMLSMALDELPLLVNGRKLEEMIKRQKLDEYSRLRPVNQKYFSLSGVGEILRWMKQTTGRQTNCFVNSMPLNKSGNYMNVKFHCRRKYRPILIVF